MIHSDIVQQQNRIYHAVRMTLMSLLLISVFISCNGSSKPVTLLRISTTPEGAEVLVDSEPYGVSPITIHNLSPGDEHYVILLLDDYERTIQRFTLKENEPTQLDLVMEHNSGLVTVETKPIGAQVFITDLSIEDAEPVLIGETPLDRAKLNTGNYFLQIKKDDYEGKSEDIVVEESGIYILDFSLKAIDAYLQVYSIPTDAQIWLNGELYPVKTPAKLPLSPGEYSIGVYKTGYNMKEEIITIVPNGQYKFDAVLEKGDRPLEMVLIPEGEFIFGDNNKSPDERPMKIQYLKAFYMDKYEVTNAEFKDVFPNHTFMDNQDKYPVKGIRWEQASDYAAAVGKRLPTEEEWEKAARGMKGNEFPWGAIFDSKKANTVEGGSVTPVKTGSYKGGVSEFGCFDMSGNVYEWTSTWYNPYEGNSYVNVDYGMVYRVLRGGSFLTDAFESRSARRHYARPNAHREDYGFRCAKDLTQ